MRRRLQPTRMTRPAADSLGGHEERRRGPCRPERSTRSNQAPLTADSNQDPREAAAQAAWGYCQQRPNLDADAIRELIRRIEPFLVTAWIDASQGQPRPPGPSHDPAPDA